MLVFLLIVLIGGFGLAMLYNQFCMPDEGDEDE